MAYTCSIGRDSLCVFPLLMLVQYERLASTRLWLSYIHYSCSSRQQQQASSLINVYFRRTHWRKDGQMDISENKSSFRSYGSSRLIMKSTGMAKTVSLTSCQFHRCHNTDAFLIKSWDILLHLRGKNVRVFFFSMCQKLICIFSLSSNKTQVNIIAIWWNFDL